VEGEKEGEWLGRLVAGAFDGELVGDFEGRRVGLDDGDVVVGVADGL